MAAERLGRHRAPAGQAAPPPTADGGYQALVVDDDKVIRDGYRELLDRSGFRSLAASRASEALQLLEENSSIEVLVSDIVMPDITGLDLMAMLKPYLQRRPWLQTILVTAHASVEYAQEAVRLDAADLLIKPVKPAALVAAVARAKARNVAVDRSPNAEAAADGVTPSKPQFLDRLIKLHQRRRTLIANNMLADPVMDMLLDLLLAHYSRRSVFVTSLCLAAGIPIATAFRRIEELAQAGLVEKRSAPHDARCVVVHLSDRGIQAVESYVSMVRELARSQP